MSLQALQNPRPVFLEGSAPAEPRSGRSPTLQRRRAFTLLELILAMTVTCILAVTLYASLQIGLKAHDTTAAAVDPVRQAQVAIELIARDLETALPPSPANGLIGPFEATDAGSDGVGDTLEFFTVAGSADDNDPTRNEGVKRIDIDVEALPDGTQALVRKVTHNLLAPQVPQPDIDVLCRNVIKFNLRYLANNTWSDSWDSTAQSNALPSAVELTMDIQRTGNSNPLPYHIQRVFTLPCATN